MSIIEALAPAGEEVVDYDRENLALYAALLEADDAGLDWQDAATSLMRLDLSSEGAEACWWSHLNRAKWIVGAGLGAALVAFNRRVTQ